MPDTAQPDSVPEEGDSTAKDVTRQVSALDLIQQGAREAANAGARPTSTSTGCGMTS